VGEGVVKVLVDGASCMGHGRCYGIAPDLFTYDDEGYPTIRDELVEVSEDLAAAADEAAGTCPEEAITLIAE
jgi:ferredoxin